MLPDENCGRCRFFVSKAKQDNKGECRKHAPHPGPGFSIGGKDVGRQPQWPEVDVNCCCGEFERKA